MRLFHRHKWTPIAIQHGTFILLGGDGTTILERCDCGDTRNRTINGHWTLEQLTGKR